MAGEGRKKVLAAYGKTEKDLADDVQLIKEWFKSQPHLPEIASNERIEYFIVNNKFSLEKTKRKLDMYYTIRGLIPSVYDNSNPKTQKMKDCSKTAYIFNLPKLVDDVYQVTIFKLTAYLPNDFDANLWTSKSIVNTSEVCMSEHGLILGGIVIYDHEHLKMDHIFKMTPMYIKNLLNVLEKVLSSRVKALHVVNYPSFLDGALKIFRPLMKPKIYDRIIFHPTHHTLADYIPLDILPKDYGGNEKSIEELHEIWNKKVSNHQARFDELDILRVNEKLRPTPIQDIESFGLAGTFKKLNVD